MRAPRVSDFEITETGDGQFAIRGDMSFRTAERILRASTKSFAGKSEIEIDLSSVEKTDSAGLALLLEWMSRARQQDQAIRFAGIPDKLLAIAQTTELDDLLNQSSVTSSSKK